MYGLDDTIIQKIITIFKTYPEIEKALLYGSRVMGTYKNGSDIDISLLGDEDLTQNTVFSIREDIDQLYLPYIFDISIFSQIDNQGLIKHIQEVGEVLMER